MANWYVSSADYAAVPVWSASTARVVGDLRRQTAPTVGNERVFRCTTAGTTGATEPTWVLTKGATTADGTAVWTEVTGNAIYNGDGGGTAWGAPFANLLSASASGWAASGDVVYVRNTHNVTYSVATNLPFAASNVAYLCTNSATTPPASASLTTGAVEQTSSSTTFSPGNIAGVSGNYLYGLTFKSNLDLRVFCFSQTAGNQFDTCTFSLTGTTGSFNIGASGSSSSHRLINCTLNCANAANYIGGGSYGNAFTMIGGSLTGTAPTIFLQSSANRPALVEFHGVDLSLCTGTLFSATFANFLEAQFVNCKLGSGVTLTNAADGYPVLHRPAVRFVNCDSGATNYRYRIYASGAVVDQETSIVRSGGASDGTTSISWKAVTQSLQAWYKPAPLDDIFTWNTLIGSARTASIYLTTSTALTNATCWVDLEYLGSSTSPLSTTTTTKAAVLATGTALTTDASTWGGTAQTFKYRIDISFTPQMVGLVRAKVFLAAPSATIYIDPKLVIT
jgi:hypothetical protein